MDFELKEQNNTNQSTDAQIQLNSYQEAALAQLECWLPHLQFELNQRYLDTSISQNHTVAMAQLEKGCFENDFLETWILASIPSISEIIVVAAFRERPIAFIDFIAELDSLSETADHITHGFNAAIEHSVLLGRDLHSYTLLGFNEIWPELQLQGQKNQARSLHKVNMNSSNYFCTKASETNFQGLITLFQKEHWTKPMPKDQEQQRFRLEALARANHSLQSLALSPRTQSHNNPVELPTITAPDNIIRPSAEIDSEAIRPQDIEHLRRFRQGPTLTTYLLFSLFIIISAAVFWLGAV